MKKVHDIDELRTVARQLARSLVPKQRSARVVALSGDLGAGKTTFVQALAQSLGIEEAVTSPTFVLEKVYALSGQPFARLVHIDAYRLKSVHELEALGWKEVVSDPGNLVVLEWPERIEGALPADAVHVRFDIVDDGRIITIDGQS